MSHWYPDQDYEEPDTTISYTLNFVDGGDSIELSVWHPASSDELTFTLTDPALVAALHTACQSSVDGHFRSEDAQEARYAEFRSAPRHAPIPDEDLPL